MMNDHMLLFVGASVFGLMVIGITFTILEFRQLHKRGTSRSSANSGESATR